MFNIYKVLPAFYVDFVLLVDLDKSSHDFRNGPCPPTKATERRTMGTPDHSLKSFQKISSQGWHQISRLNVQQLGVCSRIRRVVHCFVLQFELQSNSSQRVSPQYTGWRGPPLLRLERSTSEIMGNITRLTACWECIPPRGATLQMRICWSSQHRLGGKSTRGVSKTRAPFAVA